MFKKIFDIENFIWAILMFLFNLFFIGFSYVNNFNISENVILNFNKIFLFIIGILYSQRNRIFNAFFVIINSIIITGLYIIFFIIFDVNITLLFIVNFFLFTFTFLFIGHFTYWFLFCPRRKKRKFIN